ncbi:hypothetical protein MTO96_012824 [Rhipicephalus appendiculatus]
MDRRFPIHGPSTLPRFAARSLRASIAGHNRITLRPKVTTGSPMPAELYIAKTDALASKVPLSIDFWWPRYVRPQCAEEKHARTTRIEACRDHRGYYIAARTL